MVTQAIAIIILSVPWVAYSLYLWRIIEKKDEKIQQLEEKIIVSRILNQSLLDTICNKSTYSNPANILN